MTIKEKYEQEHSYTVGMLVEAIERSRMETGGITLDLMARVIKNHLAPEEVNILIERLSV